MLVSDAVATTLAKLGAPRHGRRHAQGHSRRFKKQRHVLTTVPNAWHVSRSRQSSGWRLGRLLSSMTPSGPHIHPKRRAGWSVTHRGESSNSALEPGFTRVLLASGHRSSRSSRCRDGGPATGSQPWCRDVSRGGRAIPLPDASVDAVCVPRRIGGSIRNGPIVRSRE